MTASADIGFPSYTDQVKRMDPDGSIASIVESLTLLTPVLKDAVVLEGNLPTGTRISMRTGLPSVGWRRFNEGIAAGKSQVDQFTEECGILTGWSRVDADLARLNGNEAQFRASEDKGFMVQLSNTVEKAFFYSSTTTNPEQFTGLTPRLNASTAPYGGQIIKCDPNAQGADQHSIWLVGWGPETVYLMFPKGMRGGIEPRDHGLLPVDMGGGKMMSAWQTEWTWKVGAVVKDARYLVRICNIDTSNFDPTADIIIPAMIKATYKLFTKQAARFVWYMDRVVASYLHLQARNFAKYQIEFREVAGEQVMFILGYPCRITDGLNGTESLVN